MGDKSITIANDVGYYNAPLQPEREYGFLVKVQVAADNGETLVTFSNLIIASTPLGYSLTEVGVTVSVVIVVVVVTAIVIAVSLCILR